MQMQNRQQRAKRLQQILEKLFLASISLWLCNTVVTHTRFQKRVQSQRYYYDERARRTAQKCASAKATREVRKTLTIKHQPYQRPAKSYYLSRLQQNGIIL